MFQNQSASSTPSFSEFDPSVIPYQDQVVDDVLRQFDYSLGSHEIMLSGSVGSAKSILMAHLLVRHCIEHPGARGLMARRAMPDLRDTIYTKVVEHLQDDYLIEGKHYKLNDSTCYIEFPPWRSEILSKSWADKKYKKLRSLELSMAVVEETTENVGDDENAYHEIVMRVGRLPKIKQNVIINATNPDAPSHWAYDYFIEPNSGGKKHKTRHVYYSRTEDNPFLPKQYIEKLKENMSPMMARRMLYGEWIELAKDIIYHQYLRDRNYRTTKYKIVPGLPLMLCYDFNIGIGKPMSVVIGQHHPWDDSYHWFNEVIIQGSRTEDTLEELSAKGMFELDHNPIIEVYGDATGEARSTNSRHSDYDIIRKYLANYQRKDKKVLPFSINIPRANPPVRDRHNIVNAYCFNALGQIRFYVYDKCAVLDKGMRLTALKKGASYIEDDSNEYQHSTTAVGYCIVYKDRLKGLAPITVV